MQTRTSNRFVGALALLLPLLTISCGGSADAAELNEKGSKALNSGDAQGALKSFQAALEHLEPGTSDYMKAKTGEIDAMIQLGHAEHAKDALFALGPQADENMYTDVASKLYAAKHNPEAIAVLDAGIKLYAESPQLKALMDKVIADAQKQGDANTLKDLEGLGYLGGGD
jgi:thioredoxin-like negative regulator of GroEL